MRRFLRIALILLGLLPGAASARSILVLGDSLSAAYGMPVQAGWVALLQQRLKQPGLDYEVVNASVSGETTGGGLARLPALLVEHRPQIVIIALGGNDGLRGQAPEQTKHNIGAMVAKARAVKAKVLLVGVPLPPNYGKRYIDKFNGVYRETAAAQGVAFVPSILEGVSDQRALFQADGIHPTAQAQPRLMENLWSRLQPLL